MIKTVLTKAGFIEGKTFKETRFLTPPKSTYAIYLDSYDASGADNKNLIRDHTVSIELYSYKPDPNAEKNIESAFDELGIEYSKSDRYWHDEEQLYQTVYTFEYFEKIGG